MMTKHFVTFYSPGTLVAEESTREISAWDVEAAIRMARKITERYGARPYGFRFTTRSRGPKDFNSRETRRSGFYYLNCRVRTLEDIEKAHRPDEEILRSNMRANGWTKVAQTITGWSWTQPLLKGDTVLPARKVR